MLFLNAPENVDIEMIQWWIILPVLGMAAFVGGILQVLFPLVDPDNNEKSKVTFVQVIVSGFFGFGGGMAVLLAAIWVGKVPGTIIELVSTGIVSGFIGYRILPKIANQLENRVSEAEKDLKKVEENINKLHGDIQEKQRSIQTTRQELVEVEKACLIAKYRTSLNSLEDLKRKSEYQQLAIHLEDAIKKFKETREFYQLLGCAYKKMREYGKAIEVMDRFIARKQEGKGLHYLFFNRACYKVLKATEDGKILDHTLVQSGLTDLKTAIKWDNANQEDAWVDPDFSTLKKLKHPKFFELVGKELPPH